MRNNYKTRRKALGWDRAEFATQSGVSISTIIRAEQHKAISPLAVRAIEQALAIKEAEQKTEVAQ